MATFTPLRTDNRLAVRVLSVDKVADGVLALELRPLNEATLPTFTAGAHIEIELPIQRLNMEPVVRQYSLCNDPAENHRYVIAVGRDTQSRGGSQWIHEHLQPGDRLSIRTPRNHFQLNETAPHSILIAGGIGVTPLLAMARRLSALKRPWTFFYCARSPERAAFLDELHKLPGTVVTFFDGVPGGARIDLAEVVANAPPEAHLYCCGPSSLIEAFERASCHLPQQRVHIEWFKPRASTSASTLPSSDGEFELTLAKTGLRLKVPADKSILEVLIDAGISVRHSCCDGVCGTCETRVLEGQPDHRDCVLFGDDARCTDRLMVCVSRSAGPRLTLDL